MLKKLVALLEEQFKVKVRIVGNEDNILKFTVQDINLKGVNTISEISDVAEDLFLKRSGTGITVTIKLKT